PGSIPAAPPSVARAAGAAGPETGRFLVAAAVLLAAASAGGETSPKADLVFTRGAVYTVDAARSFAEAVAVADGRIAYVGSASGAGEWIGPGTEVIDLAGRMLLPGFQDAHVHPLSAGVEMGQCDLNSAESAAEVLERVRACAAEKAPGEWLVGGGWQLPLFPEANPHRRDLDAVRSDIPILLWAADGHSGWANSQALTIAGITAATEDPPTGRIERDSDGSPSGTLRESAVDLVTAHVPETTPEEQAAGLLRARDALLPLGVTTVQDASVDEAGLAAYAAAQERGEFPLRVVAALYVDPDEGPEQVDGLAALRQRFAGERLRPTHAKLFLDGVIEARTASMLEPYTDKPGEGGTPEWPNEKLSPVVERLAATGFSIHCHAIGDAAVRQGLDALERARAINSDPALRHQLAHIEVIHPADQPRFRRLHVIANFQALWAYADPYIVDLTWPGIGPERSQWIYPIGSVARAGAPLALGSDWSVSSPNPLEIMEVAITRRDPDSNPGDPGEPMQPEERIDLPTALAAATIGAAYANGLEADTGSIEVGKAADLVVLAENPFEIDPAALSAVAVDLTVIGGEIVYRRAAR
ncbi:MAG: amidohydrolase, partial [Thermoanaerobaculia bacterium]